MMFKFVSEATRKKCRKAKLGEKNPKAKICVEQALSMRAFRENTNLRIKDIAKLFGVSGSIVTDVVLRRTWRHV